MTISGLDFVGVPTQDPDRARKFYGETLGLQPDEHQETEFWVGGTCLSIWEPERLGMPFQPQKNGHLALHVDDIAAARAERAAQELFALAVELGGTVSGEHGVGWTKAGQLDRQWAPRALDLHEAVKQAFDPAGLMNPGKKSARLLGGL